MFPPGRNDLCPCGSGRPYQRCHGTHSVNGHGLRLVEDDAPTPMAGSIPTPRAGARWEADLLPLPISFSEKPDARPGMLLITGDGYILYNELLPQSATGAEHVGRLIVAGAEAVANQVGRWPPTLAVRSAALAEAVGRLLPADATRVVVDTLPDLDAASRDLLAYIAPGTEHRPLGLSAPETWKGWGLPPELTRELFDTAAAYYRARPWRLLANEDLITATCASGATWTACVLGDGGIEFGLALYNDPMDLERQLAAPDDYHAAIALQGPVLSLTFTRRDELPKLMRKEILAAGWTVASPEAYPLLFALNTPGGGISATQAADLRDLLRSIGRFAARLQPHLATGTSEPQTWRDPETGATLTWHGYDPATDSLWPEPETLAPALPHGPGAKPDTVFTGPVSDAIQQEMGALLDRFHRTLAGQFSALTADRHTGNAELLIAFLHEFEAMPLAAMSERELRIFLYDWVIRVVQMPRADRHAVPVSLQRFLRFVAGDQKIHYPWADAILTDREIFEARVESFPGGPLGDPETMMWVGELTNDLDNRLFLPEFENADDESWEDPPGPKEHNLDMELHRRWLIWRDEEIAAGVIHPAELRRALVIRQRAWERSPHPAHRGKTPRAVIAAERRRRRS